jgi:hypothetical protein
MDKPLVKNASNVKEIQEAKRSEKNKRWQEKEDLQWVLNSPSGRRYLWKVLCNCGIYKTSYGQGEDISFLEGRRNIGLSILDDINDVDRTIYSKMMEENK